MSPLGSGVQWRVYSTGELESSIFLRSKHLGWYLCEDSIYATPIQTTVVHVEAPRSASVYGVMRFCCLCMVPRVGHFFRAFVVHDQSC